MAIQKKRHKDYYKARIDKTQQNSKCTLCGERDKTIDHKISECNKLVQKAYKTRNDRVDKEIHKELCNKFKFNHTNKWFMHNPESVLENGTHKILFEIQTDHLITSRRPNFMIVKKNKRTC